jgi:hypothetical protein
MDELLLNNQNSVFRHSTPCTSCHAQQRNNLPDYSALQFRPDSFRGFQKRSDLLTDLVTADPTKRKELKQKYLGKIDFSEFEFLESPNYFIIDPKDYEQDHPLRKLHEQMVQEYAPGKSPHGKTVMLSYGNDYWNHESRELGKSGDFIEGAVSIPVGIAAFEAGTALATGAGVVSGILVTATGVIVAVVIVAGVSYLIHLGIQAADDSGVEITGFTGDIDFDNFKPGDMPDVAGVAITRRDDYVVPYANETQTLLFVLDEDGMLREVESEVKEGKVFPFLNGDERDLDITQQKSINDAWSRLTTDVIAANLESGRRTRYERVLYEGMSLGTPAYSCWTSQDIIEQRIPIVPANMQSRLSNFKVTVKDEDGDYVGSSTERNVLKSLHIKGIDPETGKTIFDVDPIYQIAVANKIRQAMMSTTDEKELFFLANFAAKHLYVMKDRSFHAADSRVDEMDPTQQQYDKLYDAIRVLYQDALGAMRKKTSGSQMAYHLKVLSHATTDARDYSRTVDAKVFGEAFSELKLEKGTRVFRKYGYESFQTMFDQTNFADFKAWAQRNEDKFIQFVTSNEDMKKGIGLEEVKEYKVSDLSDDQIAKVFIFIKSEVEKRQRAKSRVLINLLKWAKKNPDLLKDAPADLIKDLEAGGVQNLSDEQLEYLIQVTSKEREGILQEIYDMIDERAPKTVNGIVRHSLISSENLAKTINEVLFDLRYIDEPIRDKGEYFSRSEIREFIAADAKKTEGFEDQVRAIFLASNQQGNAKTLDPKKLDDVLFSYMDLIDESEVEDKDRKSDILIALSDYLAEDKRRLELFAADFASDSTGVDDFKRWVVQNDSVEMDDKSNTSINKLRLEILQTLQYIERNAANNPFKSGILAQIKTS